MKIVPKCCYPSCSYYAHFTFPALPKLLCPAELPSRQPFQCHILPDISLFNLLLLTLNNPFINQIKSKDMESRSSVQFNVLPKIKASQAGGDGMSCPSPLNTRKKARSMASFFVSIFIWRARYYSLGLEGLGALSSMVMDRLSTYSRTLTTPSGASYE